MTQSDGPTSQIAFEAVGHRECRGLGIGYRLQQARLGDMRCRGFRRVHTEADRPKTIGWYLAKFGCRSVDIDPKKHDFSLPEVDH